MIVTRRIINGLCCLICLFCTGTAIAQQIRGRVTDAIGGQPIPFAAVQIKERPNTGTQTDQQGHFTLPATSYESIIIRMIGYEPQVVSLQHWKDGTIIPMKKGVQLDAAVITASLASSRSKRTIGSNVESIKAEDAIANQRPSSLADIINGRVTGVQVYNTNGKAGMPIRFNVRSGATLSMERDPLVFIDGVRYSNSNISDINSSQEAMSALNDLAMDDIASIDIIKGPSAAASYGAEAANGVIVIKTKKGLQQQKGVSGSAKYSLGVTQLARKYDQFVNNKDLNDFFRTGISHNLYAGLNARFDASNSLYLSVNSNNNQGHVPGNNDNRYSFRTGYDFSKDRFKASVNLNYVQGTLHIPQSASGKNDAIWNLMLSTTPWSLVNKDTWFAIERKYDNRRFTGNLQLSYVLPGEVKLSFNYGMDQNQVDGLYYVPYGYLLDGANTGNKTTSNRSNQNSNWDFKIARSFRLGEDWGIDLSVLSQQTRAYEKVQTVTARKFATDGVSNIGGATEITSVTEEDFEKRTHGIYGEAFLHFKDQLYVNAGLRRDVSNLIGRNVASIYYPSVSVAYNLEKAAFLANKIEAWKLRAAYGESGRLPYPNDAVTAYKTATTPYGPALVPDRKGNPDIRPERTREIELGTDFTFKKQQLSVTWYNQQTSDAIVYTTLTPSDGWPSSLSGDYPENIGLIRGSGWEVSLNSRVFTSRDQRSSIDLFASFNQQKNKVINTGGREIVNLTNVIREGDPAFAFYNTTSTGPLFDATGKYTGAAESSNHYLGKPNPDYYGSFGFRMQLFRHLNIQSMFTYSQGATVYNIAFRNVAAQGNNLAAKETLKQQLQQYTPGTKEYIATATQLANYESYRGNFHHKADFIRLSNVNITYDASDMARRITKGKLQRVQFSLSGNNLWLTTNYPGAEPQVDSQGGSKRVRGISYLSADWTAVPAPRTFAFTTNIGF